MCVAVRVSFSEPMNASSTMFAIRDRNVVGQVIFVELRWAPDNTRVSFGFPARSGTRPSMTFAGYSGRAGNLVAEPRSIEYTVAGQ